MHLRTPLFLVAVVASVAHAQYDEDELVQHTNITGSVPVPGFRMDVPYPGDWSDDYDPASGDGWRLTINLTEEWHPHRTFMKIAYALLPPQLGKEGALFRLSNVTWNGTNQVQVMPSWAVDNATADTWSLWFGYPEFKSLRTVEDGNNSTDGSCPESVISAECQQEIRQAIKDAHGGVWSEYSILNYESILKKLQKCGGFNEGTFDRVSLDQDFRLKSGVWQGGGPNEETMWDEHGSRTYPIIAVFGQAAEVEGSRPLVPEDSHIVFACVKADTIVSEGSRMPEWNSSGVLVVPTRWAAAITVLAAVRSFLIRDC